jgi:dihydroorotate dehydrogenase electron transfer subunit
MSRFIRDLRVLENKRLSNNFFLLTLETGISGIEILPGQFIQIRVDGSDTTFLRRPFSVHDFDYESGKLKLLIHVVGPGSKRLSEYRSGELLNVVFPLGNSFTISDKGESVLLMGGGCGVAPLLYLGRKMRQKGITPKFLLGFKNVDMALRLEEYESLGEVWLMTEDGSVGEKGLVTDHPALAEVIFDRIYCCGPEPMMKAAGRLAASMGAECEVSLENMMACGFGVCLCCVTETVMGNLCTCIDGPVFNTKELKW